MKTRTSVLCMATLAIFLWGATPIATKLAVTQLDPLLVGALRTLLAAPLAVLVLLLLRLKLPTSRAGRLNLLLSALGGFVVFPLLFSLGQQRTSAAHGALVLALLPVITGLVAAAVDRRAPRRRWWVGSLVALAGTALLLDARFGLAGSGDAAGASGASLAGDLMILASCLAASTGYVTGARAAADSGTWSVTFWGLVIGGFCLLPLLPWLLDGTLAFSAASGGAAAGGAAESALAEAAVRGTLVWGAVAYLAFGSSILAYAAWYWALAQGDIARTGQIQFAQPVIGVVLAAVLLGEVLTPQLLLAAVIIFAGVALAQSARTQKAAN